MPLQGKLQEEMDRLQTLQEVMILLSTNGELP